MFQSRRDVTRSLEWRLTRRESLRKASLSESLHNPHVLLRWHVRAVDPGLYLGRGRPRPMILAQDLQAEFAIRPTRFKKVQFKSHVAYEDSKVFWNTVLPENLEETLRADGAG